MTALCPRSEVRVSVLKWGGGVRTFFYLFDGDDHDDHDDGGGGVVW